MSERFAIAVFFFLQGLCAASWAARIPFYQAQLRLTHGELGTLLLALPAGTLCAMPAVAFVLQRISGSWPLRAGALAQACLLAGLTLTPGTKSLAAALFAFGCANTWVQIAVNQRALNLQRQMQRPVMAAYHGCWSVAAALAGVLAHASNELGISASSSLRGVAACSAAIAAMAWFRPQSSTFCAPEVPSAREPKLKPRRALIALALLTASVMAIEAIAFDWAGILFRCAVIDNAHQEGLGYAVLMVSMTVGRLGADRFFGSLRASTAIAMLSAALVCGLASAACAHQPGWLLAGLAATGLGLSAFVPMLLSGCATLPGIAAAQGLSWVSGVGAIGALVGPSAMGWLAGGAGLRPAFGVAAAVATVVGAASWRYFAAAEKNPPAHGSSVRFAARAPRAGLWDETAS